MSKRQKIIAQKLLMIFVNYKGSSYMYLYTVRHLGGIKIFDKFNVLSEVKLLKNSFLVLK